MTTAPRAMDRPITTTQAHGASLSGARARDVSTTIVGAPEPPPLFNPAVRDQARGDPPTDTAPHGTHPLPPGHLSATTTPRPPTGQQPQENTMTDGWTSLRILAEQFHDAQKARIAASNRVSSGEVDGIDYEPMIAAMRNAENTWAKALRAEYRRVVPDEIREWQQSRLGIGEHLLARLLGAVGHPVHAVPHWWAGKGSDRTLMQGEPFDRSAAQLRQYCGHGDPTRKRRKGMSPEEAAACGNPTAKMLVRLLAEACMKQRGIYRKVYDERRAYTAEHRDWTPLHEHNDALRLTGKAILDDLHEVAS